MVESDNKVLVSVKKYIKKISKIYTIKHAYIFGSYVNGKYNEKYSDIDLAVFVEKLYEKKINVLEKLYVLTMNVNPDIEPHLFSMDEYKKHSKADFVNTILENGIKLI